jgi:AraC-like DNA-binding protein
MFVNRMVSARTGRHPGLMRFGFSGLASSPGFSELSEFAQAGGLKPRLVPTSRTPSSNGLQLLGSTATLTVSQAQGFAVISDGTPSPPKHLVITTTGPGVAWNDQRLWVGTDATSAEVTYKEPNPVFAVVVPIAATTIDWRQLDAVAGSAIDAPPLALSALRSAGGALVGSDVLHWVATVPEAIDRYLVGLTSLIASSILDSRPDALHDHSREWLHARATAWIDAQYQDPGLSPARIAVKLQVSQRAMNRAFEGQLGIAATIRSKRIQVATAMLADPSFRGTTIAEISQRCGFISMATFIRSFDTVHGVTPRVYRATLIANADR